MSTNETLQKLAEILEQRKNAQADESYVASLYQSGLEKILEKISEEADETVEAAREEDTEHLVHEVADLWFHCMVLLAQKNVSYEEVLAELNQRFGISGLLEKAQR
jgi:phosphoribosyl-ATP pyrophosphohydrolase